MAVAPMTLEEFVRLPDDDDLSRELIAGVLVERPATHWRPRQSVAAAEFCFHLSNWLDAQPERLGVVAVVEVRCRLARSPDTVVGIDVAYFEGEEVVRQRREEPSFDGPPVLAIEILGPSDTHGEVVEKIHRYLDAGTKQVWIADPDFRTITVHRAHAEPAFYHRLQDLPGGPELPRFQVPVGSLFGP